MWINMHLPASRIVNHPFCALRQWIRVSFYVKQLLDEIFASIDCVNPSPLKNFLIWRELSTHLISGFLKWEYWPIREWLTAKIWNQKQCLKSVISLYFGHCSFLCTIHRDTLLGQITIHNSKWSFFFLIPLFCKTYIN